jgi:hypothetical protein
VVGLRWDGLIVVYRKPYWREPPLSPRAEEILDGLTPEQIKAAKKRYSPKPRSPVKAFIAEHYPNGPGGKTYKEIARRAKDALGLAEEPSDRTIRRAFGKK